MAAVKTAISIERELYEAGEQMARELNISRSDLYARALQSYLRQQRRRAIRDQINAVESSLTDDERAEEQAITEGLQHMTAEAMRRAAERGESW